MKETLHVTGMSCGGCQLLVKEALEELDGVREAEASFRDATVTIDYDPAQVDRAQLLATITTQGFHPEP